MQVNTVSEMLTNSTDILKCLISEQDITGWTLRLIYYRDGVGMYWNVHVYFVFTLFLKVGRSQVECYKTTCMHEVWMGD